MELSDEQKRKLEESVRNVSTEHEDRVRRELPGAEAAAQRRGADPDLLDGVKTLWRMLIDPDYTITWETKRWIIFGLAYFISPIDIIPDVLPGIGYVDDLIVVMWVLHKLHEEVTAYRNTKGSFA